MGFRTAGLCLSEVTSPDLPQQLDLFRAFPDTGSCPHLSVVSHIPGRPGTDQWLSWPPAHQSTPTYRGKTWTAWPMLQSLASPAAAAALVLTWLSLLILKCEEQQATHRWGYKGCRAQARSELLLPASFHRCLLSKHCAPSPHPQAPGPMGSMDLPTLVKDRPSSEHGCEGNTGGAKPGLGLSA